jgi:hypothetical protein
MSEHANCRKSSISTPVPFVPTRLLDVSNDRVRLIETKAGRALPDADRRYVALSHCWGPIPIITTLQENYQDHLQNIPLAKLSKTFREAVHGTRMLGFRYLWIDSLCIIQKSKSDWEVEAATMCDVYRRAAVTLAAAHAPMGEVGCFQERDGVLQFPFVVELPQNQDDSVMSKQHRVLFTSLGRGQGLLGSEPPLYGRAWYFSPPFYET